MRRSRPTLAALVTATLAAVPWMTGCADAQETDDPFPEPIEAEEGVIVADVVEFARIPDVGGDPARMMTLEHEPGTDRIFVSDMRGPIYHVSGDGERVTEYLDVDDPRWGVSVDAGWREMGVQNFALHPQFAEEGAPGHGKIYVWTDTDRKDPRPDFAPPGGNDSHDTVLLEFTAEDPTAATYDGGPPRELMRFEQPFGNHNGGELTFDPTAEPGDPGFGLLHVGVGDGGAGGDPMDLGQDPSSAFGKVLRIDPLGSGSANGEYGVPGDNPYAGDGDDGTLGEIYLVGLRNPQHLAWDEETGAMFVADIGQNTVEEVSRAEAGDDLGWNSWEGSFRFTGEVDTFDPRSDPEVTYPVAEYDHEDPLFDGNVAVTGLHVARDDDLPALEGRLLFGDLVSGEIFHVSADDPPEGGQAPVRRVLLDDGSGEPKTLLELVEAERQRQGRGGAGRVDLRLGETAGGHVFLLNKHDGVLRLLVPEGG